MAKGGLKRGEKMLFGVIALICLFALASFVMLEVMRARSDKPMYASTTHYDFSEEGLRGSTLFRYKGCTSCHRALRNGTNMGLDLDGIGSRRSLQFLVDFLRDPEATYGSKTVDHGQAPKEAAKVALLPEAERHAIAVFLSELTATQGSVVARVPPTGRSGFIDEMVKVWAPDNWKSEHHDIREEETQPENKEEKHGAASK
jgi:Cytochrome c